MQRETRILLDDYNATCRRHVGLSRRVGMILPDSNFISAASHNRPGLKRCESKVNSIVPL